MSPRIPARLLMSINPRHRSRWPPSPPIVVGDDTETLPPSPAIDLTGDESEVLASPLSPRDEPIYQDDDIHFCFFYQREIQYLELRYRQPLSRALSPLYQGSV